MINLTYNYLVVEDDLRVCESIKERMDLFKNWECVGLIADYITALDKIKSFKPELIFLDYSILGGNSFELIIALRNIQDYNPYLIYFTGYGTDQPHIIEDAINTYRVNKFLHKPIWEKLTSCLPSFIEEAENWICKNKAEFLWIETTQKIKLKINPKEIVCINQPENNPRLKTFLTSSNQIFDAKLSWEACEFIAKKYGIDICYAKSRDTLINKAFISKIQRPYVWLNGNVKIIFSKQRWRDLSL